MEPEVSSPYSQEPATWARWIQSVPVSHVLKINFNIILTSTPKFSIPTLRLRFRDVILWYRRNAAFFKDVLYESGKCITQI
jgi:hypothetical protein